MAERWYFAKRSWLWRLSRPGYGQAWDLGHGRGLHSGERDTNHMQYGLACRSPNDLLPSSLSDLQPVKTVWALTKGNVGMAYLSKTKYPVVLACFQKMLVELRPQTVKICINKTDRNIVELPEIIQKKDSVDLLEMGDDSKKDPTDGSGLEGGGDSGSESEDMGRD